MKIKFLATALCFVALGCGSSYNSQSSGNSIPAGTTTFTVTAPYAPSSYSLNNIQNPSLTLQRGQTYTFNISTSGHPFYIMSTQGTDTANAFSSGVTGNGTQSGTLSFVVPAGAPNTLYYDCSVHAGMTGTITVTN
jgi:plastocyanin